MAQSLDFHTRRQREEELAARRAADPAAAAAHRELATLHNRRAQQLRQSGVEDAGVNC